MPLHLHSDLDLPELPMQRADEVNTARFESPALRRVPS